MKVSSTTKNQREKEVIFFEYFYKRIKEENFSFLIKYKSRENFLDKNKITKKQEKRKKKAFKFVHSSSSPSVPGPLCVLSSVAPVCPAPDCIVLSFISSSSSLNSTAGSVGSDLAPPPADFFVLTDFFDFRDDFVGELFFCGRDTFLFA